MVFTVHLYFKSLTGATLTMGKGAVVSLYPKQKLNTKISTESKLVGADDVSSLILWTNVLWNHKGIMLNKTFYINIIKLLSYYRKMVKIVQAKGQDI